MHEYVYVCLCVHGCLYPWVVCACTRSSCMSVYIAACGHIPPGMDNGSISFYHMDNLRKFGKSWYLMWSTRIIFCKGLTGLFNTLTEWAIDGMCVPWLTGCVLSRPFHLVLLYYTKLYSKDDEIVKCRRTGYSRCIKMETFSIPGGIVHQPGDDLYHSCHVHNILY